MNGRLGEEVVDREAGVALVAVGVEDPEARPSARRAEAVPRDHHLRPLADDVPPEPDPRAAGELETEPGRLGDRGAERRRTAGWLEQDEQRARTTGKRRQPVEAIRHAGGFHGRAQPSRQVDDQQVDGPAAEERPRDRKALVEVLRRDDDQPRQADAAGDGLDRVERARDVEPGDDRAGGLGLGGEPERERGLAARAVAAEREAGRAGHAARAEDRIERGEAGRDDALGGGEAGRGPRIRLVWKRYRREGTEDLANGPRSCRTPARLERRESGGDVRGERGHRTTKIEQMFD